MIKKWIIVFLSLNFILSSCILIKQDFILIHKIKKINLKTINDQIKIGIKTDSAIFYIRKNDAIKLFERLLKKETRYNNSNYELENKFNKTIDTLNKINDDFIFCQSYVDDLNYSSFIEKWILEKLIYNGKVEIFNQKTKQYEKQITYHFIRDRLGGKEYYLNFENGTEFYRQILCIGE